MARDQHKEAASPRRGCDGRSLPHRVTSGPRCYPRALQQLATQKATNGARHQQREARAEPNGNRDDRYGPSWQIVVEATTGITEASMIWSPSLPLRAIPWCKIIRLVSGSGGDSHPFLDVCLGAQRAEGAGA
jgi:hypothetical protein